MSFINVFFQQLCHFVGLQPQLNQLPPHCQKGIPSAPGLDVANDLSLRLQFLPGQRVENRPDAVRRKAFDLDDFFRPRLARPQVHPGL